MILSGVAGFVLAKCLSQIKGYFIGEFGVVKAI